MNITTLKKSLAAKSKPELIEEITQLYKKFPDVKNYYQAQQGDATVVLEKYQDIIKKEFVDGYSRGQPKARLSVAKKAVHDFHKISSDPVLQADIMLTFVEVISDFNKEFGVDSEPYYTSPEGMFEKALAFLKKNNLLPVFGKRAYQIVSNAIDAWGHFDSLEQTYSDFYEDFSR